MTPACMTPDELRLWRAANAVAWVPALSPCVDCPVAFARQMQREGCCNGVPSFGIANRPRQAGTPATERRRAQWRAAQARKRERAA